MTFANKQSKIEAQATVKCKALRRTPWSELKKAKFNKHKKLIVLEIISHAFHFMAFQKNELFFGFIQPSSIN